LESKKKFVECQILTLGKESLCRVPSFAECLSLPSAALGKEALCRVRDIWHSAKAVALGKEPFSRSEMMF
jgi:hypothetical protein